VYNVEKYIERCLMSVMEQTYTNFEVIVINDGSPANEQIIIDKFTKKDTRFRSYTKKNGGLSDARNYGVQYVSDDSDYIFFLDSDDYIEKNLLKTLNKELEEEKVQVLKFRAVYVDEEGKHLEDAESVYFKNIDGINAQIRLFKDDIFMTAWSYVYMKDYWIENKFEYPVGKIHEDIALTPIVLVKAASVTSLDYVGLYYVQRNDSIMSQASEEKLRKKANDVMDNIYNLLVQFETMDISKKDKEILNNFFARMMIHYVKKIEGKVLDEYLTKLKELKIYKYVSKGRFRGRFEYILMKYNLPMYLRCKRLI